MTPEETPLDSIDERAPRSGGGGRKFNIAGDVVHRAAAHLPERQRLAITWLHAHGWDNNIGLDDLAHQLRRGEGGRYNGNTLYKIFTGKHEAKLDNFTEAVEEFRKLLEERAKIVRTAYIHTRLAKKIFRNCDSARVYQKVFFLFGETQTGKSTILEEYARQNNHGRTVYIRLPEGGRISDLLVLFAEQLKMGVQSENLRRRIVKYFDPSMLLIVDEAHQSFISSNGTSQARCMEFLREIYDSAKCGMVICGTNVLQKEILQGSKRAILNQFWERQISVVNLPPKPSKEDLNDFAKAYGLPPASGEALTLQDKVIREHSLGLWLTHLQLASSIAGAKKKPLAWNHVLGAAKVLARQADPNDYEDEEAA